MKDKTIRIGEARRGHSFPSQGEGAIPLQVRGKQLPLLARTVYAEKVSDNIMSVPEAVDKGYTVVFNKHGVDMYEEGAVRCDAKPILKGARDPRTRLFYINIPYATARDGAAKAAPQVALLSRIS